MRKRFPNAEMIENLKLSLNGEKVEEGRDC